MPTDPTERFEEAIRTDGRYPLAAYIFLQRGLEITTQSVYAKASAAAESKHVTGQQLCHGLRALAVQFWGLLAPVVLKGWGIQRTRDFGEMVYFMIQQGFMGGQESDSIDDFNDVYDLESAFISYTIPLDSFDDATRPT